MYWTQNVNTFGIGVNTFKVYENMTLANRSANTSDYPTFGRLGPTYDLVQYVYHEIDENVKKVNFRYYKGSLLP